MHFSTIVKFGRKRLYLEILAASALSISIPASLGPGWAQSGPGPARVTEAVDATKLLALRGNTHPLARPEFDRGPASDEMPMERILLVLKRSPEQEDALRHLLDEQQTKSSPNFHHWLTPEEFGQRFGPADADIQAVTEWLTSEGFEVKRVAAGRTVIEFSGSAGLVREALHTEIHQYDVNGKTRFANASDPRIPQALEPVVAGFDSLNSFPKKPMHRVVGAFRKSKTTGEVRPLFSIPLGGGFLLGVGPTDFATIYNVLPLWNGTTAAGTIDGTGQSIAIVGDSNINIADVRNFRSMFGLPAKDPQIILDGPDPGLISGSETEADLDVEWAGAVAKNATIKFVVSEDTEASFGADLSALYIIDNNIAPVLSVSFGACEAQLGAGGNAFFNAIWEQAAAQGITVSVAAGDSGSDTCDQGNPANVAVNGLSVSGVASTPFNVALGGTDFNDLSNLSAYWSTTNNTTTQASVKSYIPEQTWNDSCAASGSLTKCPSMDATFDLSGGGGGPSAVYPRTLAPWQTGPGVPNDGTRDLPDVSLFSADGANGSLYIICESDVLSDLGSGASASCTSPPPFTDLDFVAVGGTSASAPSFAGIMALVNQAHGRQGNANYVLYPLAAKAGASCTSNAAAVANGSCTFYDINNSANGTVNTNNSVACAGGSPNCSSTNSSVEGVLVNPNSTSQAAWTNTAGYDLATGLGTLNAANLVKNWTSVTFTASTTTLALTPSPVTITHGQSVNVSIHVTPSTATGDVSLLGGPVTPLGIDGFTLSGGSVASTTNLLPGGTYSVTAHYAGNGTVGASDSAPVPVIVNKESSQASVSLISFITGFPITTAPYGSPYVLRFDVGNSTGQLCSAVFVACPTGTLTWTDNGSTPPASDDQNPPAGTVAGSLTLNSQAYAEDQYIQFLGGAHTIVASYGGDNSFNSSTSSAGVLTITPGTTSTSLTASDQNPNSGALMTLTADITTQSSGVAPSHSVQFLNGTTPISGTVQYTPVNGSFSSAAQLTATLQTSFTSNASVKAVFAGDSNYSTSTSSAVAITPRDFSLSATAASPSSISPGQSATSTVSISPINGFTGTLSLSCAVAPVVSSGPTCTANPASVTPPGTTSSVATISTTSSTPPGNYTVTVTGASGTLNHTASFAVTVSATPDYSLSAAAASPSSISPGQSATSTISVAPVNGFTGTVSFACSVAPSGPSCTMNPASSTTSSVATVSTTASTSGGNYTVTVTGTSGALTHTASFAITVTAPDFSLSGTTPAPISPGQSANSTITVSMIGGFSGTVSFTCAVSPAVTEGPGCSIPGTVSGSGTTTLTITTTAPSTVIPLPGPNWIFTGGAALLATLFLLTMFCARKRPLKLAFGLIASAALAASLIACGGGGGGGGGNPGTPKGNYTVSVTATSGALSHNTQVPVTVQ